MKDAFFIDFSLKQQKYADDGNDGNITTVTDEDLKIINSLKSNGPLKKLTADEIQTRAIIIMGIEPTSKMSIHPQGELNGKKLNILGKMSKLLPGCPMLVGHRNDKAPWGRTYKSEVVEKMAGYKGPVVKENFWFLNDMEGQGIARKIDCGIWAEGSISYWFSEAKCSICHKPMASWGLYSGRTSGCGHVIGKKDPDTGQVCFWYPANILKVAETSYVFAGAYGKTKSMLDASNEELNVAYSTDQIEAGKELETQLADHGLNLKKEYGDEEEHQDNQDGKNRLPVSIGNSKGENAGDNEQNGNVGNSAEKSGEKAGETTVANEQDREGSDDGTNENQSSGEKEGSNSEANAECQNSGDNGESDGSSNESGENGQEQEGNEENSQQGENGDQNPNGVNSDETEKNSEKSCENSEESPGTGGESGEGVQNNSGISNKSGNSENGEELSGGDVADGESGGGEKDQSQNAENENGEDNSENGGETGGQTEDNSEKGNKTEFSSESKEGEGEGHKQADGHSENQEESYTEKYFHSEDGKCIVEILNDDTLDFDEKETAVESYCVEKEDGLREWGMSELLKTTLGGDEKKKVYAMCPLCDFVEGENRTTCKDCGSDLLQGEEYAAKVGRAVGPIKPSKSGLVNNEFFELEDFRNLPDGNYYVEPKYDGVWFELHKKGKEVKLLTAEKNDHSEKFPGIVNEAQKLSADNFVVAGEMVKFRGNQRLTHESVSAYIHSKKDEYDDKAFRYKPFDIMVAENEDQTEKAMSDRRKKLDSTVKWGKQIHPTKFHNIKHKKGNGALLTAIENRKTREGAMIKNSEGKYKKADQKLLYKWKQQKEIDCKVSAKKEKEGGGFVYSCEIGRGENVKPIGETFTTKLEAEKGQVVTVSVDHVNYDKEKDELSWFAPKVKAVRKDKKEADLISTVKKMAIPKESNSEEIILSLSDIVPRLKQAKFEGEIYLVGGIVEHGVSMNDLDILTHKELNEATKKEIESVLGEDYGCVDFIVDPEGPEGASLVIKSETYGKKEDNAWKYSKKFVLQEHGWGKKKHYDIRFGAPKTKRMWGFTLFTKPTTEEGGAKVRGQEKKYHDPKWMDVDKQTIKPGEEGNPTKKLNAWMIKKDEGNYEFVKRKPGFLEVILHGKDYKGRYVFREIPVKANKDKSSLAKVVGDEVGVKNEKIWIVWKPKNQKPSAPIKKMNFNFIGGNIAFWESEEDDKSIDLLKDVECEDITTEE